MKNNRLIYIGIVSIALSLLLFGLAFWQEGFKMDDLLNTNKYEQKTYVASDIIKTVLVKDSNAEIVVEKTNDNKVSVDYMQCKKYNYEITVSQNGELAIIKKNDYSKWYENILNFDINHSNLKMIVKVPVSFDGNIEITTSNAKISADSIKVKSVKLTTSNAKIDIKGVTTIENIQAITSNADIKISDCNASAIILDSSNGDLTLSCVKSESSHLQTSNSKINLSETVTTNTLFAKTSNGDINLEKVLCENTIELISSNAKVMGTVIGEPPDFSYDCQTSNAISNLPEKMTMGNKKFIIRTSNGKINIDFVQ